MKRRWLFVPIIVGLLALGITVGGVLAQDNGNGDGAAKSFAGRVAAILGLGEDEVKDAFTQAATEARQERLESNLDLMVEQGIITEDQAGEYLEWYQSKPSGLDFGHRFRGGRSHSFSGGRMFGGHGMGFFNDMPQSPNGGTQSFFGRRTFGDESTGGRGFFNRVPATTDDGAAQLSTY